MIADPSKGDKKIRKKKKPMRTRRTPKVNRRDSLTAAEVREVRKALVLQRSERRSFPEAHLRTTEQEWRQKKRQEWKAVADALETFRYGSAYTPSGNDLYELERLAQRITDNLEGDWIAW